MEATFASFSILELNFAQMFMPQEKNTFALYHIFAGVCPFSFFWEENSAGAAYRSCCAVYVCDNVKIRGLGRAIYEFISATTF